MRFVYIFVTSVWLTHPHIALAQAQVDQNAEATRWLGWTTQVEHDCGMHGDDFVANTKAKVLGLKVQMGEPGFNRSYNAGKELALSQKEDANTGGLVGICNVLKKNGHYVPVQVSTQPASPAAHPDENLGWLGYVLWSYILIAGIITWPLVRRPLMGWYSSMTFFTRGRGPVDILIKQIGYRLSFELSIFICSCVVGALGGWLTIFFKKRPKIRQTAP